MEAFLEIDCVFLNSSLAYYQLPKRIKASAQFFSKVGKFSYVLAPPPKISFCTPSIRSSHIVQIQKIMYKLSRRIETIAHFIGLKEGINIWWKLKELKIFRYPYQIFFNYI